MASVLDTLSRPHRGKYRPYPRQSPIDRIARHITYGDDGCWLWTGRLGNMGYGLFTVTQTGYPIATFSAHKATYELHAGRVPEGLVLDHICRVRHCVNPAHLEAVRQRENTLRSPVAIGALNAAKTHCAKGHEFTPENTYVYRHPSPKAHTERVCRACRRLAYQARKRSAA